MSALLTTEEVRQLTGAFRKKTQSRVLRANGIAFFLNAAGWPVVPRTALEGQRPQEKAGWKSNKE